MSVSRLEQPSNIDDEPFVALPRRSPRRSNEVRLEQFLNMEFVFVTYRKAYVLSVLKDTVARLVQFINMATQLRLLVTAVVVLNMVRARLVRAVQSENIYPYWTHFSKVDSDPNVMEPRFVHPANIYRVDETAAELNMERSREVKDEQPLNI